MVRRGATRGLLLLVVIAGGVMLALPGTGRAAGPENAVKGLIFQEKTVTFSNVYPGELVEYVFRFRNDGPSPVRILEVKPT